MVLMFILRKVFFSAIHRNFLVLLFCIFTLLFCFMQCSEQDGADSFLVLICFLVSIFIEFLFLVDAMPSVFCYLFFYLFGSPNSLRQFMIFAIHRKNLIFVVCYFFFEFLSCFCLLFLIFFHVLKYWLPSFRYSLKSFSIYMLVFFMLDLVLLQALAISLYSCVQLVVLLLQS